MVRRLLASGVIRAVKLDGNFYREARTNARTGQAFLVVILAGLATGIGAGVAGVFVVAGLWSLWGLFAVLIGSIIVWLAWSFLAYFIGVRLFKSRRTSATVGELLRATGFSAAPGLLGILLFVPVVGGFIWLIAFVGALTAGVVAIRQALEFTTVRAITTCLASWLICLLFAGMAIIMSAMLLIDGNYTLGSGLDSRVKSITGQYRFSITGWEITTLATELGQRTRGSNKNVDNAVTLVNEYFSTADAERKKALASTVELILEKQIKDALVELGITGFPPVNLKLETMPHLLVISPRERIETIKRIMLEPEISSQATTDIESRVDGLNVSSLVVQLGGFAGAYPSFVGDDASLRFTLETAVEEWVHQYLAFKPLGFRYILDLLGIAPNYEIATINETVAGIVSKEIAAVILDKYYPELKEPEKDTTDFDALMREVRLVVDDYLAKGEIEAAEDYMEQQRQHLASKGYYIRKLNQAYFAWHGTYADEPTSVDPIGVEVRQLRGQFSSIGDFLDIVAMITSRQGLEDKIKFSR